MVYKNSHKLVRSIIVITKAVRKFLHILKDVRIKLAKRKIVWIIKPFVLRWRKRIRKRNLEKAK
jgi:hypothetical protein